MHSRRHWLATAAAWGVLVAGPRAVWATSTVEADELSALVERGGSQLQLQSGRTYRVVRRMRIPATMLVDLGGSTVVVDVDEPSNTTLVEVNRLRNGTVVLRAGRRVERMLGSTPAEGVPGLWENLIIRQESDGPQRWKNINDNDDALLRIRNDGTRIRNLTVEDVDYCVRVYANKVEAEKLSIRRGTKGLILDDCSGFQCKGYSSQGKSPNAKTDPGHNAIGSGAQGGGPLNDTTIEGFDIFETGEHGIYFSRSYGSIGRGMRLIDGRIRRTGQCALKLRYYDGVQLRNIQVEDCSFGNRTGTNEDGLRLERCANVRVENYSVRARDQRFSGNFGVVLGGCDGVFLRDVSVLDTMSGGLQIGLSTIGDTPDYPSGDVRAEGLTIKNCRGPGVVITHAGAEPGEIVLNGLRIEDCDGPPVQIAVDRLRKDRRIVLKGTYARCRGGLPDMSRFPQVDLSGLKPA